MKTERDLTKLSAGQHKEIQNMLSRMSMNKLRRRQAQLERELGSARSESIVKNLLVIESHLDAAINRKAFGPTNKVVK